MLNIRNPYNPLNYKKPVFWIIVCIIFLLSIKYFVLLVLYIVSIFLPMWYLIARYTAILAIIVCDFVRAYFDPHGDSYLNDANNTKVVTFMFSIYNIILLPCLLILVYFIYRIVAKVTKNQLEKYINWKDGDKNSSDTDSDSDKNDKNEKPGDIKIKVQIIDGDSSYSSTHIVNKD